MRHVIIAALALLAYAVPARADDTSLNTIAVGGQAEILAPADFATVSVGVVTQGKTVAEALAQNNARMARVIAALRRLEIADADIQTFNFNITPKYAPRLPTEDYEPDELRPVVGYSVSNDLEVTVRDMKNVSQIIDASVTAGANSAGGIRFKVKDVSTLFDRARETAVANAYHKAQVLAGAAHLELGRALSVTDSEADRSFANRSMDFGYSGAVDAAKPLPPTPILPGMVRIVATVTVVYAVK